MKPISADVMFGIPIVGRCVMKGVGRQGLVKGRVEDRHLGDIGNWRSGGLDAEEIGRVVKRGQRDESPDLQHTTSSLITVGSRKTSPPWTTRWPMPKSSDSS